MTCGCADKVEEAPYESETHDRRTLILFYAINKLAPLNLAPNTRKIPNLLGLLVLGVDEARRYQPSVAQP